MITNLGRKAYYWNNQILIKKIKCLFKNVIAISKVDYTFSWIQSNVISFLEKISYKYEGKKCEEIIIMIIQINSSIKKDKAFI